MTTFTRPDPEALARARALAERVLEPEEFRRLLAIPIGAAEEEEARSLIRWFRRRYPTPAERLAYVRRAYRRWTKGSPAPRVVKALHMSPTSGLAYASRLANVLDPPNRGA